MDNLREMKQFFATICALLSLWAVAFAARNWTVIRFGVDPSYPPFESKAPSGELVGFDIDLGKALCERLKARCVWVENDFDGMIPALKARKIDAVLSSMAITEKRLQQIDFTDKLFLTPTRLVARAEANLLPTTGSLRGKNVGVEQGTVQEIYAKNYWEPQGVKIFSYQNQNQVYADLVSGRLDASLQDAVQAKLGFLNTPQGKSFAFAGPVIDDPKILGTGSGIGLRKEDSDLKNALNQALAGLLKDGTYQAIEKKYFDFDIHGG
jgi:lysine/arginine/ornithine transport system substrate-binding protein